ncbi:MAG: hypothetical protein GC165_12465 [Armatimonadetes bacterium]|nr:hypothetical protein [Armatimonadota bacterium]
MPASHADFNWGTIMRFTGPKLTLFLFALISTTGIANAQVQVSYNGDFRGGDSNVTQADTLSDMMVFDDIQVTGSHVTSIWGNFLIYQQYTSSSLGLRYEIRTGVSAGHGGTLLKSGFVSNLQQIGTGRSTQNTAYREIQLGGTVDFDLAPGTYWLGLQNNEGANPPAQWTSFLAKTLGADNGPANDPNPAPQNSILDGSAFATGTELGDWIQQGADYSVGVTTVPEPGAIVTITCGVIGLYAKLRRRR